MVEAMPVNPQEEVETKRPKSSSSSSSSSSSEEKKESHFRLDKLVKSKRNLVIAELLPFLTLKDMVAFSGISSSCR